MSASFALSEASASPFDEDLGAPRDLDRHAGDRGRGRRRRDPFVVRRAAPHCLDTRVGRLDHRAPRGTRPAPDVPDCHAIRSADHLRHCRGCEPLRAYVCVDGHRRDGVEWRRTHARHAGRFRAHLRAGRRLRRRGTVPVEGAAGSAIGHPARRRRSRRRRHHRRTIAARGSSVGTRRDRGARLRLLGRLRRATRAPTLAAVDRARAGRPRHRRSPHADRSSLVSACAHRGPRARRSIPSATG